MKQRLAPWPAPRQDDDQARKSQQSDDPAQRGHDSNYCIFGLSTSTSSLTAPALFASMAFSSSVNLSS